MGIHFAHNIRIRLAWLNKCCKMAANCYNSLDTNFRFSCSISALLIKKKLLLTLHEIFYIIGSYWWRFRWLWWDANSWYSLATSSNGMWWVIDKINVFNIGFIQTSFGFSGFAGIILSIVDIKDFFMYFKKVLDQKADTIELLQRKIMKMFIELQPPIGLSIKIYLFL